MLVLSRKPSEKVVIDGNITITVVEFNGGRVKIGIEAPPDVAIMRGELVAGREGRSLAACLGAETGRSSQGDATVRQVATNKELLSAAAIKTC